MWIRVKIAKLFRIEVEWTPIQNIIIRSILTLKVYKKVHSSARD